MTQNKRTFSLELFPPQTPEGAAKLRAARARMATLKPRFFSVTFGAGGSTRDRTLETVLEIQQEGYQAAPHLSCIGSTRESIRSILEQYRANGIRHLVALRGDLPSGMARPGAFDRAELAGRGFQEALRDPEVVPAPSTVQLISPSQAPVACPADVRGLGAASRIRR